MGAVRGSSADSTAILAPPSLAALPFRVSLGGIVRCWMKRTPPRTRTNRMNHCPKWGRAVGALIVALRVLAAATLPFGEPPVARAVDSTKLLRQSHGSDRQSLARLALP